MFAKRRFILPFLLSRSNRVLPSVVLLSLALYPTLTPQPLKAQSPGGIGVVSTSVSTDEEGATVATTVGTAGRAHHPSRVLVRFRNGAPGNFLPGSGTASGFPGDPDLYLVPNPPGLSVAEVVRHYQANPSVLYAEPDYEVQTFATSPTDPLWSQQWDMVKIAAPAAWGLQTDSADVVVAIIDTGIDYTHPDLRDNLWVNPLDGSHGFTCMNGKCTKGGSDGFGHGTHVAGTIGAAANNGIGIAGINWQIKLLSLQFLGSNGSGSISDAVLAFQKVTELKQQGVNVRLTSNSWGGAGFSQALKDAMAAAEAAGVVHVCAAGNDGLNADISPMYPAAYDNRGIISVLASDQNDVGASFTNYGLSGVDIAAPGVSTLSTVPAGACTLCDPSGYKLLSGTSMATPHVSGVLGALFHKNPTLTANQARDLVLDPGSYDALSDPKARSTSTGGRLNFAKALGNPLLLSPKLNNFPTLTMGPDVFVPSGSPVKLTAIGSDPDNDPLRMAWAKPAASAWLFGWMLDSLFPNSTSFAAPSLARTATVPYEASVADGRGGGAHGRQHVTVLPAASPGLPPSGSLTVSPTDAPVGSAISVSFPATDPERGSVAWDLFVGTKYSATGRCCYPGPSTSVTLNDRGVYRIGTQAIDRELNFSARQSAVVRIGGATGEPPIASATLDKLSGPVPLTVNIDMSASFDPDGTIRYYAYNCEVGGSTKKSQSSQGSCTFDTPGVHWILLTVEDNSSNMDAISVYAVATPADGSPSVPPGVSSVVCAPASVTGGSTSACTVTLTQIAPGGGAQVVLSSSSTVVTVPSSVTIPAGAGSAGFTAATDAVASTTTAVISASVGGLTGTALVTILPPTLSSLSCSPGSVTSPGTSYCTVTLASPAPAGGVAVTLFSSSGALTVPASVTVAATATSASFAATAADSTDATAVITASLAGVSQAFTVTVVAAPVVSALACSPSTISPGSSTTCTVTLSKMAPAGGVQVTTSSNSAKLSVPAFVTVPAGATSATFPGSAAAAATNGGVKISASAGGATKTTNVNVRR